MKLLMAALVAAIAVTVAQPPRVIDGDTVEIDGVTLRLLDIDTPETHEPSCRREAELGAAASERLFILLEGAIVTYTTEGTDRFGRTLGHVYADGQDVSQILLEEGHALPYVAGEKAKRQAIWCQTVGEANLTVAAPELSCKVRRYCKEGLSDEQAQWYFEHCSWGHKLDGDHDGHPCEWNQ